MSRGARRIARRAAEHPWSLAFGAVALLLVVLRAADLGGSPPGLYNDEASIGYNAWAVAHYGIDEHGAAHPLFFAAFGEYKNPVYVYALAPFTWFLPLTSATVRVPAMLFGLCACAAMAGFAWQVSRSRPVTLLVLLTAGIEPWLVQESRLGFEVISMVALLAAGLWCLARAHRDDSARWFAAAGAAFALSVLAYSTGRLYGALLTAIFLVAYLSPAPRRLWRWLWMLPSMAAVYVTLLVYNVQHAGALTGRYTAIGIGWDSPGLPTLIGRFAGNYATYWGFPFLATHGDGNLRHSTGFGGMLLVTTLPAIVLGAAVCIRRFASDLLCRILVLAAIAAPIPAAVTAESTPHSLRAAIMLPLLLAFSAYGWPLLLGALRTRRVVAAALAAAVCVEAGAFFFDLYAQYPQRALAWFDTGQGDAIAAAAQLAGGHEVWLSDALDTPYIQALFRLRVDPHDYLRDGLDAVHMRVEKLGTIAGEARPGDLVVLAPGDLPPPQTHPVLTEEQTVGTGSPMVGQPDTRVVVLAVVVQR